MRQLVRNIIWLAFLAVCPNSYAQVDDSGLSFAYNGYLEDLGGQPINQPVDFVFTIHAHPDDDAPTWSEEHLAYPVDNGVVQIELGLMNPIDPFLLSDPSLYLGVSINMNPEMQPRLKLEAVLRAQWARHAQDVSGEVINPASVRVNGAEVIDTAGNWVGGFSGPQFVRNDQNGTIAGSLNVDSIESSQGLTIGGAPIIDAAGNWTGPDTLNATQIRDKLLTVDGSGSSVDADLLDGLNSATFLRNDQNGTIAGTLTVDNVHVNTQIGIGTANPQVALDVVGAIKISSADACDANKEGSMRYQVGILEVCDGVEWTEVLTKKRHPYGCSLELLNVDGVDIPHGRVLTCQGQDPIRVQVMLCGNGVVEAGEDCDDGNFAADDGCNMYCQIECGDGVVGANEECDDGNLTDTDGCTAACTIAECGDGIVQDGIEECDGGQNCLPDCTIPQCANTGGCPPFEFVQITGGVFNMGYALGANNEQPAHEVTVQDFEILKGEVTVEQYKVCVEAGICTAPKTGELNLNYDRADRQQYPVNGVSWVQARQFAKWAGADLPTEAQWEFAATSRVGDQRYPWGDDVPDCTRTQNYSCGIVTTGTVCTHPTGNSVQGVCDLAGNAWEWVLDNYHATYDGAPIDGSAWCELADCADDGETRVWKGGDYISDVTRMRASARGYYGPAVQPSWLGFRIAR